MSFQGFTLTLDELPVFMKMAGFYQWKAPVSQRAADVEPGGGHSRTDNPMSTSNHPSIPWHLLSRVSNVIWMTPSKLEHGVIFVCMISLLTTNIQESQGWADYTKKFVRPQPI